MNGSQSFQGFFRCLAGGLACVAIVYAPWAWGCVWPMPLAGLELLLGAGGVFWILSRLVPSPKRKIPRILRVCTGWILLQGWFMAFNARSAYDRQTHQLLPMQPLVAFLPGASDRSLAVASMLHITVILLALLIAVDLMGRRGWRKVIWYLMAIVGASVACYGLAARWGWLPAMVHKPDFPTSPFGPFNYHGIAGAFLNLVIPAQMGLAALGFMAPRRRREGIFFTLAGGVTLLGLLVNVSRGAVLIGLVQIGLLAFLLLRLHMRHRGQMRQSSATVAATGRGKWPVAIACCVAGLTVIAACSFFLNPRWSSFGRYFDTLHSSRVLAWRVAWGMTTSHPIFGTGAGSFKLRFPISHHWIPALYSHWIQTFYRPGHHVSQWSYASEDYLQNLVEFGWAGGLAWAGILWGWLAFPLPTDRADGSDWSSQAVLRSCAWVALLGLFCHATFDFPMEIASIQLYAMVYLAILYQPPGELTGDARKSAGMSCLSGDVR